MAERLWGIRENPRVEWVDPALPAALAWAEEHDQGGRISDVLAAFVAGARWQRDRLLDEGQES